MKEYLNITRSPIYVTMKTLIFFIPIGILTSKIYVLKFGEFQYTWKLSDLSIEKLVFTISIFCVISFIVRWIEVYILPEIIINLKPYKIDTNSINKYKKYSMRKYKLDVYEKLKELYPDQPVKIEILKELMFWPITILLWLFASNVIIGCLFLLLFACAAFYLGKIILVFFDHYDL